MSNSADKSPSFRVFSIDLLPIADRVEHSVAASGDTKINGAWPELLVVNIYLIHDCGTAKCVNSAKCVNAAKCVKINVSTPLNVSNQR